MHDGELRADAELVRRLLVAQLPRWADLPLREVESDGTVHTLFRLGDDLVVRLPLVAWGADEPARDATWLSRLAPHLPVDIPRVHAVGEPTRDFPWPWGVYGWIEGEHPTIGAGTRTPATPKTPTTPTTPKGRTTEGRTTESRTTASHATDRQSTSRLAQPTRLDQSTQLAHDLADFVRQLQAIDTTGAPRAGRGRPLHESDVQVRASLTRLAHQVDVGEEDVDTGAVSAAWDRALEASDWDGPDVWLHGDLMASNLLLREGRLAAVLDWGGLGIGEPACELIAAWTVFPPAAREVYRERLAVDDATWERGRGWAFYFAINALPYYRVSNPGISAVARHTLRELLERG